MVVGIFYLAMKLLLKEARSVGGERVARQKLEEFIEMDEKRHRLDGEPIPMSKRKQSKRLRALLEARSRDRD